MPNRTIANPERGCGHLKRGKCYLRGVIGSPDGVLPSFVKCDPFVPYREMGTEGSFTRGFLEFAGISAQFALDDITDFVRLYPGDADDDGAVQNMVDRGLYAHADSAPAFEGQRHVDRIRYRGTEGDDHFGAVDAVRQSDLLMRAGKTHYPEPDDFIDEAVEMGISKAIPLSKRQDPPVIQPGVTRCWIVHPETDQGWAVIGYAYLTEIIYTEPDDGNVPQYVQEHADAGRLDVVDIEPAPDDDDSGPNATVADFADNGNDQDGDTDADSGQDGSGGDADPDDPTLSVDVLLFNDRKNHLADAGDATTICGRDFDGADDVDTVDDPDPSTIASEYGVCGTCLTALKARLSNLDTDD